MIQATVRDALDRPLARGSGDCEALECRRRFPGTVREGFARRRFFWL